MADEDMGYIYFIHAPTAGMVKIGYSRHHPEARLANLRCGSPVAIERMGFLRGGKRDELRLHGRFGRLRRHGEWFVAADELLVFIAAETEKWEPVKLSRWEKRQAEDQELGRETEAAREQFILYGDRSGNHRYDHFGPFASTG